MTDLSQSAELQQLREQLAALTRRVYQLEQIRTSQPPAAADVQTPQLQTAPISESLSEAKAAAPDFSVPPPFAAPLPPERQVVPRVLREPWPAATTAPPPELKPTGDTSLESRVGGQWLNRLGIIAVLVGLSYFLKLAFDNGWIGPPAQVIIGLLAGVGLLFWSERFRAKDYAAFAYSLKAIGFGALYLSLWAASQYYHLIPPTVAFFGMCVVTLTSAALSLRQNSELLAAFALAGGLLTPILRFHRRESRDRAVQLSGAARSGHAVARRRQVVAAVAARQLPRHCSAVCRVGDDLLHRPATRHRPSPSLLSSSCCLRCRR